LLLETNEKSLVVSTEYSHRHEHYFRPHCTYYSASHSYIEWREVIDTRSLTRCL